MWNSSNKLTDRPTACSSPWKADSSIVAQVVSHLSFTAEGRLRSQARPCVICGRRKWGGGTGFFSQHFSCSVSIIPPVLPCQYHSIINSYFCSPVSIIPPTLHTSVLPCQYHSIIAPHIHPCSTDAADSVFAEKRRACHMLHVRAVLMLAGGKVGSSV
jgi:hypothetical protein